MATGLQFPRIYLLSTHLLQEEIAYFREAIPSLTDNIDQAEIVLGRISKKARAEFELRRLQLHLTLIPEQVQAGKPDDANCAAGTRPAVRETSRSRLKQGQGQGLGEAASGPRGSRIRVLSAESTGRGESSEQVVGHGRADNDDAETKDDRGDRGSSRTGWPSQSREPLRARHAPARLVRQSTSEHEAAATLPPIPDFLHTTYSCQRPTPINPPNEEFIKELKNIRTLRLLQGDGIGVRAYSTSIAALAAYPYPSTSPLEIERLPGCGSKIAQVYQQWLNNGQSDESSMAASDSKMSTLRLFYDIWGVGDATAREFYRRGWRDLDDVIEYGWHSLSRVQQIGVKFYDELTQEISRQEVEEIAGLILGCARDIDPGFEMTIVGGHRRGKAQSGDVDVVISHREESRTAYVIGELVLSLEKAQLVSHTLSLSTRNSERGQLPLAWRGSGSTSGGAGFDTLDKAMVVWHDKRQPQQNKPQQNKPHRRVDIIISPWKTVGCALLGWSGGTTFQRDLRRYCKREKGLKFDSSGIRRRSDGLWMDFEGLRLGTSENASSGALLPRRHRDVPPDMATAERRVFKGLALQWRYPTERCTG
ncbi:uncharacterized protein UV8b_06357 [Ustilaginoidea virens]|uniref:DNA polymerase n=1 Tax=Ustilaginoidea virens TaxID=1159556 RepID=A0A8E5MJS5_USTVR|nr:uncharacterized protein UV8b_06357 [Ustilaginoidea virens]QUC22116.1 hypothetical protein UV8b_06357 [Ustilaginoidea virens]